MTIWERTGWRGGFPFSPTHLVPQARPARRDGARAEVSAARIPEAGPLAHPAAVEALPAPDAPRARPLAPVRMSPRPADLRLMPLGAFAWGGAGARPLPRTRSDHVLIWVTGGAARLDLPRQEEMLAEDDLRFVPAGTAFALRPHAGAQGHVLLLAPALAQGIEPPFPERMLAGCAGRRPAILSAALAELGAEGARGADPRRLHCYLGVLSLHLSQLPAARGGVRDRAPVAPAAPVPGPDRRLVEAFLSRAAARLGACLTLSDLAEEMGTTHAALDRACLACRGRRALDLLHGLRLEEAARRLRETDLPPSQIAQETGYAGHAHMTRAFADSMGRTPEAYRHQARHPG